MAPVWPDRRAFEDARSERTRGRRWLKGFAPAKNVGSNVAKQIGEILADLEGRPYVPAAEQELERRVAQAKPPKTRPEGSKRPESLTGVSVGSKRDLQIVAWVLARAKGECECCRKPAPFENSSGQPFLEVHHVRHLADGGSDTVENAVAVCPNCHRELHLGANSQALVTKLYAQVEELVPGDQTMVKSAPRQGPRRRPDR